MFFFTGPSSGPVPLKLEFIELKQTNICSEHSNIQIFFQNALHLEEEGWKVNKGKLMKNGKEFTFEFLIVSPSGKGLYI